MNRQNIRQKFRDENPEITERVISDSTLNSWMATANDEICCETRCIVSNEPEVIESQANIKYYDLESNIENFYDIDNFPSVGVYYNGKGLKLSSAGEENDRNKNWRNASSGTPLRFWRKGKYLWLHPTPDTSDIEIEVDCIFKPETFNSDTQEPFNGLGHLQPYCDGINKYLQWRVKAKVGKIDESTIAHKDYLTYVSWMKKQIKGNKYNAVRIKPAEK